MEIKWLNMDVMKTRLLLGGIVLIILGVILYFANGHHSLNLILPIIGAVVLVVGIIYKPKQKAPPPPIKN